MMHSHDSLLEVNPSARFLLLFRAFIVFYDQLVGRDLNEIQSPKKLDQKKLPHIFMGDLNAMLKCFFQLAQDSEKRPTEKLNKLHLFLEKIHGRLGGLFACFQAGCDQRFQKDYKFFRHFVHSLVRVSDMNKTLTEIDIRVLTHETMARESVSSLLFPVSPSDHESAPLISASPVSVPAQSSEANWASVGLNATPEQVKQGLDQYYLEVFKHLVYRLYLRACNVFGSGSDTAAGDQRSNKTLLDYFSRWVTAASVEKPDIFARTSYDFTLDLIYRVYALIYSPVINDFQAKLLLSKQVAQLLQHTLFVWGPARFKEPGASFVDDGSEQDTSGLPVVGPELEGRSFAQRFPWQISEHQVCATTTPPALRIPVGDPYASRRAVAGYSPTPSPAKDVHYNSGEQGGDARRPLLQSPSPGSGTARSP